jgi:phosphoribosyl 1,2-cyclic phosphodiesterase
MRVKFYGTRGSIPVCERGFQEFGGNTTCLLLRFKNRIAILDAGSGIRNLGKDLLAEGHEQFDNIFIGFSHFHWDHIQGFPFFQPAYDPRRHFTLSTLGRGRHLKDLKSIFTTQQQREYFPVPVDNMGANFSFFYAQDDTFKEAGVTVDALRLNHPGGSYGYRITDTHGRVLVFCTDTEHGDKIDQRIVAFARGADLLIHDAQYTPEELKTKRGWGHSSWLQALEVAEQAEVKWAALTHHDPDHDDEFLLKVEQTCQARFPPAILAREGLELDFKNLS